MKRGIRTFTGKNVLLPIFYGLLLFSLLLPNTALCAEEKKNKVVYLDLEDESLADIPIFAGLVIEDASTVPSVKFEDREEKSLSQEIELSPSLREFILEHDREFFPVDAATSK